MPIAVNDKTGEVIYLDKSGEWKPSRIAENPQTGQKLAWDGQKWQPVNIRTKQEKTALLADNPLSNITDMAVQGMTFGLADEAVGALGATKDAIRNMAEGKPANWMENYNRERDRFNNRLAGFRGEHPVMSGVAEFTGAMANPATGILSNIAKAAAEAGIVARTGKAALGGATAGAAYGAGNAEGGLAERARGAAEGAAIGGATGAVMPPLLEGIMAVGRAGIQRILSQASGMTKAERKVAEALRELGNGDIRAGYDKAVQGLAEGGPGTAPVDVMGMTAQRYARAAANVPGEGSEIADRFVKNRMAGRGYRFRRALDEIAPPENAGLKADEIKATRAMRTGPIYERVATPENMLSDEAYREIAAHPFYRRMEKQVLNDPIYDFGDADPRSLDVVHQVKQRIDDEISSLHKRGRGSQEPLVLALQKRLINAVDKEFPDYRKARWLYSDYSRRLGALDEGLKFTSMTPEQIVTRIREMGPQEAEEFRIGMRNALDKMIATDTQAAATKLADKKLGLWEKIRAAFPDAESFRAYKNKVENELQKMETERFIGPRAGSHTTPLAQDIKDTLSGVDLSVVPEAAADTFRWNALGLALAPARRIAEKVSAPNKQTAKQLAKILLETNRPKARKELARLALEKPQMTLTPEMRREIARLLMFPAASEAAAAASRRQIQ